MTPFDVLEQLAAQQGYEIFPAKSGCGRFYLHKIGTMVIFDGKPAKQFIQNPYEFLPSFTEEQVLTYLAAESQKR